MKNSDVQMSLSLGHVVEMLKVFGDSMTPIIKSGQSLRIEPVAESQLSEGDIVFCKVRGNYYVHKITQMKDNKYQISNNHGHVNGWTTKSKIYGIVFGIFD